VPRDTARFSREQRVVREIKAPNGPTHADPLRATPRGPRALFTPASITDTTGGLPPTPQERPMSDWPLDATPHLLRTVRQMARRLAWQSRGRLEADDLEQEGLLAVLQARQRHNPALSAFEPFALRRARGAMVDYARRICGRRRGSATMRTPPVPLEEAALVDATLLDLDDHIILSDALSHLPVRDRRVLERRLQGFTLREIAREEHVSVTRVSEIHTRALRQVRQRLLG
jgi:DNA-directed RNA polymerase